MDATGRWYSYSSRPAYDGEDQVWYRVDDGELTRSYNEGLDRGYTITYIHPEPSKALYQRPQQYFFKSLKESQHV